MHTPFTHKNIPEIFGADAADTEDAARLYTFFLSNDSYEEIRAPNPITLIVGQKGIGKTALMRKSSMDDRRDRYPNIFIKGSRILGAAELDRGGSATINQFRDAIESSLLEELADFLSKAATDKIGAPEKVGNIIGSLARFGASIASGQDGNLKLVASKFAPWLLESITGANIYIDDTDVEWDGGPTSANRISRLLQACFQIAADSDGDVKFKISMRSDLFNYLSVRSDFIDKVQSGIVRCRWSNDQIFRVIAKRIATYEGRLFRPEDEFGNTPQEHIFQLYFSEYFEDRFHAQGAWENAPMRQVLLSFVRQRPRDLIGLCRLAATSAMKHQTLIDTRAIQEIIPTYCKNRLNDTIVEFRNELPEIEKLLQEMRPAEVKFKPGSPPPKKRNYYTHDELISKINNIKQRVRLQFSYSATPASAADIAEFLFRINFLVASRKNEEGQLERMYYDFADQKLHETRLGRWDWEVHMAYRWAIQHDSAAIWKELREEH